ncbi:uncharacterized protein LOC127734749 [Mytilus californianus]|uniref:uncharacterized protein LOC127734749 n=1 Tax=Mytilus californianus TaxID=6549 RepID=UPI002247E576|nr:uncharacterized protein LOC127734749 [Mytilus californianus]XP_052100712.1 uncharacterized protein LOC127734749 [Mytilus californianus]
MSKNDPERESATLAVDTKQQDLTENIKSDSKEPSDSYTNQTYNTNTAQEKELTPEYENISQRLIKDEQVPSTSKSTEHSHTNRPPTVSLAAKKDDILSEELKHQPKEDDSLQEKETNKEKPKSRISRGLDSSRKVIAWITVGKIGPGFLVAPALFSLTIHTMMFVLGIKYSGNCQTKPLVPVALVLIGGDGMLKSLSYLLQIVIVIQTKMRRHKAFLFLSESSIIDSGLNYLYICAVFLGAGAVFSGEMAICEITIFEILFYYIIIALSILGLLIVLVVYKAIKPNEITDFIDVWGNIV